MWLGFPSKSTRVLVTISSSPRVSPASAGRRGWSSDSGDRHFGIGADGVLLVGPPSTPGAVATMTVLNADGSRPEMCGNGIRCVAIHLATRLGGSPGDLVIDTDAGPRRCKLEGDSVEVEMGALTDRARST